MKARFDGTCIKCGLPIKGFVNHPSDAHEIQWTRKPRPDGLQRAAWHEACNSLPDNPATVKIMRDRQDKRLGEIPTPTPNPVQYTESQDMPQTQNGDFMAGMANALVPYLTGKVTANLDGLEAKVTATLDGIEPKIKAMIDAATRNHIVIEKRETGEFKDIGLQHKMFSKLAELIALREHSYLYGQPGWGKSSAAIKYAKAAGLDYGFIAMTPQTQDSKLYGFVDAHGNPVMTTFYKLWVHGGVMVIEELDQTPNPLLVSLNNALEQRIADFPGHGTVEAHPDFICIGCGNTNMRGPVPAFPDRRKIDASVVDRFTFLEWGEDREFERHITLSINEDASEWLEWIQAVRDFARSEHPGLLVSPRASYRGAKLMKGTTFDIREIADMALFKDFDKDSVKAILKHCPLPKK